MPPALPAAVGFVFSTATLVANYGTTSIVVFIAFVQGSVIVDSTAVIVGNITSKSIQINNGAIVNGSCHQTGVDEDIKKFFTEGIEEVGNGESDVENLESIEEV